MKSEIVDVNETRRDLTIEVPSTVVDEAIGSAAAKLGKQAKIPGFRPGKVPSNVIRQRFKPQARAGGENQERTGYREPL